ncbi:uncharacterized protein LOC131327446 [Rhododendron vialii]|uniref:uncharacterized protein LOC131327446 n=1 Tax=Rhododendron vialii TaxID=182163 RepID=UPI00265FEC2E|nr:uncharacterized protein LOC131327446 [Rhododendron vialii]
MIEQRTCSYPYSMAKVRNCIRCMSTRVGTSQGVKECHENPLLGVFGTLSSWLPKDRNSDTVTNLGESTIAMMLKKDPRCCGFKARKYSCLLDPSGTLDSHQSKRTKKEANHFNDLLIYASYTNGIQAKRRYIHFDEITIPSVSSRALNLLKLPQANSGIEPIL